MTGNDRDIGRELCELCGHAAANERTVCGNCRKAFDGLRAMLIRSGSSGCVFDVRGSSWVLSWTPGQHKGTGDHI